MGRPENPITGNGPVADLARALREIRARAGNPPYRELAKEAHRGASVLAEAATGKRCPSWEVTRSFATACDMDAQALYPLWVAADSAARKAKSRPRRAKLAAVRQFPVKPVRPASLDGPRPAEDLRLKRTGPDPWKARTPTEYVWQLRALRAWGGSPGYKEVSAIGRRSTPEAGYRWLSTSTFYDAISPSRVTLPPLRIVRPLVQACDANVEEWTLAWKALSLREFEKANPLLPAADPQATNPPPPSPIAARRSAH